MSEYTGGDITVEIEWSETVSYKSTITIPAADFAEFWTEEVPEDAQMSEGWVEEYLNNDPDQKWFEQCDTTDDFHFCSDRQIDTVTTKS